MLVVRRIYNKPTQEGLFRHSPGLRRRPTGRSSFTRSQSLRHRDRRSRVQRLRAKYPTSRTSRNPAARRSRRPAEDSPGRDLVVLCRRPTRSPFRSCLSGRGIISVASNLLPAGAGQAQPPGAGRRFSRRRPAPPPPHPLFKALFNRNESGSHQGCVGRGRSHRLAGSPPSTL